MRSYLSTLLLAVAYVALCGCGQTGPLYMPPETVPVPPAMPGAAEPAAAPTAPASTTETSTKSVGPPRSEAP